MKPPALERNDTWGDQPEWLLSGKVLPAGCEMVLAWLAMGLSSFRCSFGKLM